jgi:hypothetical protein
MKLFICGFFVMMLGVALVMVLQVKKVPRIIAVPVGISVICLGGAMELGNFYTVHRKFKLDIKKQKEDHEAVMEEIKHLPPEEAIRRLLQ